MLGTNIGIDLGTSSVAIYVEGKGVVLNEPSVVAYDSNGKIKAVGKKAAEMSGRNPSSITVVKPVEYGVVSDFTATRHMVQYFMTKICKNMIFKPNVVVCIPSMVTQLEKRTILDLVTASGAARACLIEEPLAAALGAGIDSNRHKGVMVVDIGAGTTDIAVITRGSVSLSDTVRVAGNALDEAIMRQLRMEKDVVIGKETAEEIKKKIGSAIYRDVELGLTIKGKSYITNQPVYSEVTSSEVFLAMRPKLLEMVEAIKKVLSQTPPELSADILDSGIYLTGGGAMLRGISKMISEKIGVKTVVPADSLNCVALGAGKALSL